MIYNKTNVDYWEFFSSDKTEMMQTYKFSNGIFVGYKIKLQQNATNYSDLNSFFVDDNENTKLFAINWNKSFASYSVESCIVSVGANTKRLKSYSLVLTMTNMHLISHLKSWSAVTRCQQFQ